MVPVRAAVGVHRVEGRLQRPEPRQERRAQKDKVALEKERLMKRTGFAAKLYRENAPRTAMGLIEPSADAAGSLRAARSSLQRNDTRGRRYRSTSAAQSDVRFSPRSSAS